MTILTRALFFVICTCIFAMHPSADALEAGAAKTNLVPPFPTKMAGFFDRHDTFTGVDTPLYARALVCDNGDMTLGMVVVDLCYVTRELTDLSYPAIARSFGGRDHTTVIHAVDKIGKQMAERRQIFDQVNELITALKNGDV